MRQFRFVRWSMLLLAVGLGGCTTINQRIEANLRAAQELAERCESFDQNVPNIDATQLLGRVKKRLSLACEQDGNCPFGVNAELANTKVWFASQSVPPTVTTALASFSKQLGDTDETVNNFVTDEKLLREVSVIWNEVRQSCRLTPDPYQCGINLNKLVAKLGVGAAEVKRNGQSVVDGMRASRDKWNAATQAVADSKVELTATGHQAVNQIRIALQSANNSLHAIAASEVDAFRGDFFDRLLPTLAAEKVLDFTERQLEPVDRLFEKADEKTYLMGSLTLEANRSNIQSYFDRFYLKYVREKFPSTESAVAFARAACIRLGKPTPVGKPASTLTPFLYSSLTLVHLEAKAKQVCLNRSETTGETMTSSINEQKCDSEIARIRKDVALSLESTVPNSTSRTVSLESALAQAAAVTGASTAKSTPQVPQPKVDAPEHVYDVCLLSEQLQQVKAAGGDSVVKANIREESQKVCGEVLLAREKEQYRSPESAKPLALDLERKAIAAEMDKVADQVALQGKNQPGAATAAIATPATTPARSGQDFCQWLRTAVRDVMCLGDAGTSWIELPGVFNSGRYESVALVPALRTMSRAIAVYQTGVVEVVVFGAASDAAVKSKLPQALPASDPSAYGCKQQGFATGGISAGNRELAVARARWAASVMAGTAPDLQPKLSACAVTSKPQPGDQPFDRKLALKVNWQLDKAGRGASPVAIAGQP